MLINKFLLPIYVILVLLFNFNYFITAKKQNGTAFRTNSLGSSTRSPPSERKSKFSIGKLLRPWKWKRKRKSDKMEAVARSKLFSLFITFKS